MQEIVLFSLDSGNDFSNWVSCLIPFKSWTTWTQKTHYIINFNQKHLCYESIYPHLSFIITSFINLEYPKLQKRAQEILYTFLTPKLEQT